MEHSVLFTMPHLWNNWEFNRDSCVPHQIEVEDRGALLHPDPGLPRSTGVRDGVGANVGQVFLSSQVPGRVRLQGSDVLRILHVLYGALYAGRDSVSPIPEDRQTLWLSAQSQG